LGDLCRILSTWLTRPGNDVHLKGKLSRLVGAEHFFFVNAGRTGLSLILKAFSEIAGSKRNEVIVPAYTCFSVAAAIRKAGFKLHPVDLIPETMDYDYTKLATEISNNTLAVINGNLFGVLSNIDRLRELTGGAGAFLIDDAAQTFGSSWHGQPSGTLGDAGFYSLDRGKNMTAYSGGVIVVGRDDVAAYLSRQIDQLSRPGLISNLKTALMLCVYSRLLHPALYWLPASLPFLGLGETHYDEQFELSHLGSYQTAAACVMIDQLEHNNETRKRNSGLIIERLKGDRRFTVAGSNNAVPPIYLRLPLLCESRELRDRALVALREHGIQGSFMYPSTIAAIPELSGNIGYSPTDFPGGQRIVETLLVLPTNPFLTESDIKKITETLTNL
jgi:dTDP-4-amino-4,6-dideoxygalactose transaminase